MEDTAIIHFMSLFYFSGINNNSVSGSGVEVLHLFSFSNLPTPEGWSNQYLIHGSKARNKYLI